MAYGFSLEKSDIDPVELLSKREFEVLSLIASGQAYKEIAGKLNLSPKTVSTYRTRILEKLNLTSTAQLLRFAYEHNIPSY
jgi:DNA-binding NarL/FixJ family response regulator